MDSAEFGKLVFVLFVLSAFPAGCLFGWYLDVKADGNHDFAKGGLKAGLSGIAAVWVFFMVCYIIG